MRAAILEQLNAPLVVDDLGLPPTLEVGQVLVDVHYSGICGAQIGEIAGRKGPDRFLPHLLGHEGGGIVRECGPGVTQVKPGDRVVMHWREGSGIRSRPPIYARGAGRVTAGWVTTFNDMAVVSENRLTPVPADTPLDVAALLGCAVTTALGIVRHDAQLSIGSSVAVFGCGGVGLNVVQGAAMVSAYPIIAVDIDESKLELAKRFGATHAIDSSTADVRESVRGIVGGQGVDVSIDTTGAVRAIETAYDVSGPTGRTVLVGQPHHAENISIHTLAIQRGKTIVGSEGGQTNPTADIPRYLRLYEAGRLRLDELITHRFPLADVNTALDEVRAGRVGRCVIEMR
jgi:S-(hydroxymethyl)glutathione dehydrogenase/alcohol dehydrogenase